MAFERSECASHAVGVIGCCTFLVAPSVKMSKVESSDGGG